MNSKFLRTGWSQIGAFGTSRRGRTKSGSSLQSVSIASDQQQSGPDIEQLMANSKCTASDLMPKSPRESLFRCISVAQTMIPSGDRDRCMNCASLFDGNPTVNHQFSPSKHQSSSSFTFSVFHNYISDSMTALSLKTGKHHCRHCGRVVCSTCSNKFLSSSKLPTFVKQANNSTTTIRLCLICHEIFA